MIEAKRALTAVSIATGLSLFGDSAMYVVLPTHTADAGVTLTTVGILLSANRFIRLIFNGPIGVLVDRWPRRRIFVPAVFLGALSTGFYVFSQGFEHLLIGRLLWGVAWAGLWISGNTIVLDITKHDDRGRSVGYYHVSFFLGAAGGALLGGVLTDWLGYRNAMALAGGLSLTGAFIAALTLPETATISKPRKVTVFGHHAMPIARDRSQLASAMTLYGVNRLLVAGILVATFGLYLLQSLGEAIEVGNITVGVATLTGIGLGITTLIGMVAAPMSGFLSDRLTSRWGVASAALGLGSIGFTLLAQGLPATMLLGLPMVSTASGSNQGLSTALVGDLTPGTKRGRQLGIFFTVGDLASAIGPPLAYALLPLIGLGSVYVLCAGLFGVMLVVSLGWAFRLGRKGSIGG